MIRKEQAQATAAGGCVTEEYQAPPHRHRHRCWTCGTVWEHSDKDRLRPADAHNCPRCGVFQFVKYLGPERPAVAQEPPPELPHDR